MVGSTQEDLVGLGAGRAGLLAALVALAIALAVMPTVLAVASAVAGPIPPPDPQADWLGQILQSLNVLRLGTAAGLLLTLPLLRGER